MTGWRIDIRSDVPAHEASALPAAGLGDTLDLRAPVTDGTADITVATPGAADAPAVADAPAAEVTP
jgi:hypothetical protein